MRCLITRTRGGYEAAMNWLDCSSHAAKTCDRTSYTSRLPNWDECGLIVDTRFWIKERLQSRNIRWVELR